MPVSHQNLTPVQAALLIVAQGTSYRGHLDLTVRHLAILLTCYRSADKQTVRGLAERLRLDKSVVSRGLSKLESHRLLKRDRDPIDGRSVLLSETPGGHALLKRMAAAADLVA